MLYVLSTLDGLAKYQLYSYLDAHGLLTTKDIDKMINILKTVFGSISKAEDNLKKFVALT